MLSAEERRRLDQIERLLRVEDPAFVARMAAAPVPYRRRRSTAFWLAASAVVTLLLGLLAGWSATMVAIGVAVPLGALVAVRWKLRARTGRQWQRRPHRGGRDYGLDW